MTMITMRTKNRVGDYLCKILKLRFTVKSRRKHLQNATVAQKEQKGDSMKTGLTKSQKTTEIFFDEKDSMIHIRTHNTDLKNRLTDYAEKYPNECRLIDTDPETGCMEFDIRKGRLSFRLTAPYSEERRKAASETAKKNSVNRK